MVVSDTPGPIDDAHRGRSGSASARFARRRAPGGCSSRPGRGSCIRRRTCRLQRPPRRRPRAGVPRWRRRWPASSAGSSRRRWPPRSAAAWRDARESIAREPDSAAARINRLEAGDVAGDTASAAASNVEIGDPARPRPSRCAANFGQLSKPCARAMTNCAPVSAQHAAGQRVAREGLEPWRMLGPARRPLTDRIRRAWQARADQLLRLLLVLLEARARRKRQDVLRIGVHRAIDVPVIALSRPCTACGRAPPGSGSTDGARDRASCRRASRG